MKPVKVDYMHCRNQIWELKISHFTEHCTLLWYPPGKNNEHTTVICPE